MKWLRNRSKTHLNTPFEKNTSGTAPIQKSIEPPGLNTELSTDQLVNVSGGRNVVKILPLKTTKDMVA